MIPMPLNEIVKAVGGRAVGISSHETATGVSTDSRTCGRGDLFFALRGPAFDGNMYVDAALEAGAVAAVVDQKPESNERPIVLVSDVTTALGRLAAFHRKRHATRIIAVTGSNGKTTTKSMIDHVLSRKLTGRGAPKSYNNAIGVPLTLLSTQPRDEYLVVEIGSNAPGEVAALAAMSTPDIGVVTSIGDAHLEGLRDRNGVALEKLSLFDRIREGGLGVLNLDDADEVGVAESTSRRCHANVVTFGRHASADVRVTEIVGDIDGVGFTINGRHQVSLPCPGLHNALNAAAAFAVCRRMNMEPEMIVDALATFESPEMRLNVSRFGGLTLIDDSYNANPTSVSAAVDVLKSAGGRRRVFVGGEMLELGQHATTMHERAGREIAEAGVELMVAIGDHGPDVISGVHSVNHRVTTLLYADTETACADLPNWLTRDDTVLIKGSRGLHLDKVATSVRAAFA